MTVPCGGTGVSEENETQSVKPGDYESSDSGAFLCAPSMAHFYRVRIPNPPDEGKG
jgi:hypothetical protein